MSGSKHRRWAKRPSDHRRPRPRRSGRPAARSRGTRNRAGCGGESPTRTSNGRGVKRPTGHQTESPPILPPRPTVPWLANDWDDAVGQVGAYHERWKPRPIRGPWGQLLGPRPAEAERRRDYDRTTSALINASISIAMRWLTDTAEPPRPPERLPPRVALLDERSDGVHNLNTQSPNTPAPMAVAAVRSDAVATQPQWVARYVRTLACAGRLAALNPHALNSLIHCAASDAKNADDPQRRNESTPRTADIGRPGPARN